MKPLDNRTDEDLVLLARDGSQEAFNELVDRYTPVVYRVARGIVGVSEEAEDVVQETFLRTFQHLERFSPDRASFKTWLLTIARNQSINVFGFLKRRATRFLRDFGKEDSDPPILESLSAGDHQDAESLLSVKQEFSRLQTALQALPERQRTALLLKTQEDLSYEEIGKIMNSTASAVESLIFRARRQVIGRMKD
jgi:RNA polymerase sigma-70 factor, ECF subfamily